MHYSAVQTRALQAMGLVPWVLRRQAVGSETSAAQAFTPGTEMPLDAKIPPAEKVSPDAEIPPDAKIPSGEQISPGAEIPPAEKISHDAVTPRAEEFPSTEKIPPAFLNTLVSDGMPALLPSDAKALARWLPLQGIRPDAEARRGARTHATSEAGLLVLFEPVNGHQGDDGTSGAESNGSASKNADSGLSRDSHSLFEAMMRSIDLAPSDLMLATLSPQPLPDGKSVADLLAFPHRAVLLMVQGGDAIGSPLESAPQSADEARFEFDMPRLSGWRCPHPDRLLHEPLRKRDAWQVLKAVRRALSATTA